MERFFDLIKALGVGFIVLGLVAFVNTIYQGNPQGILWFCYLGIILIGAGMFWKNTLLIESQLNILAIPLIIWTADFFYIAITGNELLGITNYFFDPSFPIISKIISIQHIFTIPVSFFVLHKLKLKKIPHTWRISFIQLILVFTLSVLLTNPLDNLNCVYENCMSFSIPIIPYQIVWFSSMFILVFATNFILRKIFKT